MKNRTVPVWLAGVLLLGLVSCAAEEPEGAVALFAPPASVPGLVPVAQGWAQTSINIDGNRSLSKTLGLLYKYAVCIL